MVASPWSRNADEVLRGLDAGREGLSESAAQERLGRHGPNLLPAGKERSFLLRLADQFQSALVLVLLVAGAGTAILGDIADTVVILAVVLINAAIGLIQEGRAAQAMRAVRNMLIAEASVLRDGTRRRLAAENLVPGDIVRIEGGDRVPADLRLIEGRGLRIDESALTGESTPVDKSPGTVPEGTPLAERSCMVWSGTMAVAGQGTGVVVATGPATEVGRLARSLEAETRPETPLSHELERLGRWITALVVVVAFLVFAIATFGAGLPMGETFITAIAIAVAAVPEGLPAIVAITLAVGVQRMAARKAIVRRLKAVETLGSVSVICTDKTGTLTQNRLVARSIVPARPRDRDALLLAGALCNDAILAADGAATGDPTDIAILRAAADSGRAEAQGWARVDAIPFDAERRFMATLHRRPDGAGYLAVKGAPETILGLCQKDSPQDAEAIATRGERVIGVAAKVIAPCPDQLDEAELSQGLELLGYFGLFDAPRPEAVAAVGECRSAGIAVRMVTGDHKATALAIAREVGIDTRGGAVTGPEL
ncbi:MAG: HAD-IC family P-type ATPase, partial [Alphaproteobacteria bacterium]|nr:HAD-IC family P-type ATPase [Alphaproteobacteria bacterium]